LAESVRVKSDELKHYALNADADTDLSLKEIAVAEALSAYQNAWRVHIGQLIALNSEMLVGETDYEKYVKYVNGIALSLALNPDTSLSEQEEIQLRFIAALCHDKIGPIGSAARAITG